MHPEWNTETVAACLVKVSAPSSGKLQTKDYKPAGKYPIVDQSQDLIAGWTDDDGAVISSPLPIIVFGDHTRALKYVDFPFVRGADGTQLLRPRQDIDPLYFFYACRAIDLPSRGYNRHFTVLKEKEIPLPHESVEQNSIGKLLQRVEKLIDVQSNEVGTAQELKRAAMRELFTKGLRGEPQKQTDIGLVPESWDVSSIGQHFQVASGGTPSRNVPEYWSGGTIPWVKTTEVSYCSINSTEEHITQSALANSAAKMFPVGTILMAMYGQGVTRGKVAVLGIEAACNQACAAIFQSDKRVDDRYLFQFLTSRYEDIRRLAHGGQQQNLNLEIVRDLALAFPSLEEQLEIASILDAIDRKIDLHKRKKAVLEELFKSLLHKLMTGEIRVSDLDLTAIQAGGH